MPIVEGLDGCWVIRPELAAVLVPILRRAADRELTSGGYVAPIVLAEIAAGERAAALARPTTPDATPDALDGSTLTPVTVPDMDHDTVVGLRPAAKLAGVTPASLHERCRRNTIPHRRDERGRYVFRRADLAC